MADSEEFTSAKNESLSGREVMNKCTTAEDALAFVREHGIVLVSAKGPIPRLTEAIIGEPITGSWWAHPRSHHIFEILEAVTESDQVLVCRLVDGKITLVHRRLWPALVRLARRFTPGQLAQVIQEHTPSGRHANREIAFPHWVPAGVVQEAKAMGEPEARIALDSWLPEQSVVSKGIRGKKREGSYKGSA